MESSKRVKILYLIAKILRVNVIITPLNVIKKDIRELSRRYDEKN